MDDKLFDNLLEGVSEMKAHRTGKKTGARVHVPEEVDVTSIRNKLKMTQEQFCITFGFKTRTLKSWESGNRTPEDCARILLKMIDRDPKAVLRLAH